MVGHRVINHRRGIAFLKERLCPLRHSQGDWRLLLLGLHWIDAAGTPMKGGGQTMKASRLDDTAKVRSFRLNDKCAAGTGAFIEKTARYMGYSTEEIGPLVATSKIAVPISGVCAVFAESEVINQRHRERPRQTSCMARSPRSWIVQSN